MRDFAEYAMHHAWLIPLLPAIAFTIIVFLTKGSEKLSATVGITAILSSFVLAIAVVYGVILAGPELADKPLVYALQWFSMPGLTINMGVLIDPTSAMMLFVVTLVASLVQIYSLGYMKGDVGFSRFFAYLNLFAMSMLGLVIASNMLQLFIFWELVGLCSYLLIGFWFFKDSAKEAAKKAFITTRVGDFGLLLGILSLQLLFGTLDFVALAEKIPHFRELGIAAPLMTFIAVLVFIGPIGKSGQFPLHVWLPDAMEGPTPVSALIHAATMVVAGVYLIARSYTLFHTLPDAMLVVAYVGGFTALFAASIAMTQREMKRILAYSTVSQLGYMVMALGLGAYTASMFHLMTHAFFKALMFLGAGSVLHAMHGKADIFEMGGLAKKMPWTTWTFMLGWLAIAGIPPFAGFFSKDEILLAASHGNTVLYVMASFTALLTAFYMSRLFFVTFFTPAKPDNHPHESPFSMVLPLVVLGFLSIVGGWVNTPWAPWFGEFVRFGEAHHGEPNYVVMIVSTLLAIVGIGTAYYIYIAKLGLSERLAKRFSFFYKISYNKYYIDELYLWIIHNVIDKFIAKSLYWIDLVVIDGIVNGAGTGTKWISQRLRYTQSGQLQTYALVLFFAVVALIVILALTGPNSAMLVLGGGN